ncbi:MAG: hypothetical protein ACXAC8_03885 [Candidatus Hodarchaeales archaeon]|jgi:hypothetical protein
MSREEFDGFSSVSSSIFYGIRHSQEKQSQILNISTGSVSTPSTYLDEGEKQSTDISETIPSKEIIEKKEKKQLSLMKPILEQMTLVNFYPEINKVVQKTSSSVKKSRRKRTSPTKQLLISTLVETKQKLQDQSKKTLEKKDYVSKKRRSKEKNQKKTQYISLDQFKISEKTVKIREIPKISENSNSKTPLEAKTNSQSQINKINDLIDSETTKSDLFPFTTITEWLIWHENYPELAFVREVYELDHVPDNEDIEVFWVNVMNEPEFFNPNWRIAGTKIDVKTVKSHGRPEGEPEWNILSSITDGFSTYFEDVWSLLSLFSHGMKNHSYKILQFALKGLFLLDLSSFVFKNSRWHQKGSSEELITRLKELDRFVDQQETPQEYKQNLERLLAKNDWRVGLVCFDLIAHSSLQTEFSSKRVSLKDKLETIKSIDIQNRLINKLTSLGSYDQQGTEKLVRLLKS